jgi:predicted Rossmann fold flavoprotein
MKSKFEFTDIIYDIAIIGAGPAGMMAAVSAAIVAEEQNKEIKICLLERNSSPGRKLLVTGKGRCNLSNIADKESYFEAFGKNSKFLYPAFNSFFNQDLIDFFESRDVKTKVERGGRIFPQSDRSKTVLDCLVKEVLERKVRLIRYFRVVKISQNSGEFRISSEDKKKLLARKVIITTGGKSYQSSGSTGDGYELAKKFGHKVLPLVPALAPLFIRSQDIRSLAGLSLKNVQFKIIAADKELISFFGDMIFTHQGISGPIVLKTSKIVYRAIKRGLPIKASIDLKPALTVEQLQQRLEREIQANYQKEYQTLLQELLPKSLIPVFINSSKIDQHRKNSSLNTQEVSQIIELLKNFIFVIDGVAPLEEAIVTAGGVDIKQINPRSMESTLIPGLYFAGELIALDGPTGGYNLQKAFSTGWLAGLSATQISTK